MVRQRDNRLMDRYVFFAKQSLDPKVLRTAKAIAEDLGVTVLKTGPGTMLVEAEPALVRKLAKSLPDWGKSVESKTYRFPERTRLQRVRRVAGNGR